jgi:hypothetical protein
MFPEGLGIKESVNSSSFNNKNNNHEAFRCRGCVRLNCSMEEEPSALLDIIKTGRKLTWYTELKKVLEPRKIFNDTAGICGKECQDFTR